MYVFVCMCMHVVCVCVQFLLHRDMYLFICHTLVQLRAVLGDLPKARCVMFSKLSFQFIFRAYYAFRQLWSYLIYFALSRLTEVCVCGLSESCMCMF